jgi:hypothetical protein
MMPDGGELPEKCPPIPCPNENRNQELARSDRVQCVHWAVLSSIFDASINYKLSEIDTKSCNRSDLERWSS